MKAVQIALGITCAIVFDDRLRRLKSCGRDTESGNKDDSTYLGKSGKIRQGNQREREEPDRSGEHHTGLERPILPWSVLEVMINAVILIG